ncbi:MULTISPECIES: CAP domain-containing protein [Anaerolinea]|uniref:CAP domain-containing protein n=1 Tax=Anaerolinea TaxID=233189 RepID=UPI00260BD995|nr:CAP domain-containing protein [Anaerolinea thermophila]
MKTVWHITVGFLVGLGCFFALIAPVSAQAGTADDLIAAVNALRAQRGLPALTRNAALMNAAQSHAEYQASIQTITHTGAGNTRPKDRAIAAGYGGGATVFVSENIAAGTSLSVQDAIALYWSDDVHMNTMLNASYQHVGAGVAFSGDMVYYTLVVGSTSGASNTVNTLPASSTPVSPSTPVPVPAQATATPQPALSATPDAALMYEVQPGDTLWGIAITYQVSMEDLKRWNNLPATPNLWPGDRLIVQPSFTPTVPPTETPVLPTPTPTLTPVYTLSPTAIIPVTAITPTPVPEETVSPTPFPWKIAGVGLIGLSILGLFLVFVGRLQGK